MKKIMKQISDFAELKSYNKEVYIDLTRLCTLTGFLGGLWVAFVVLILAVK